MSSIVAGGLMGLFFGFRHALEPDHLAAVGTCVPNSATPKRAATIGALWGAGHSASVVVLGSIVLGFRQSLPPTFDVVLEFVVGVMLVVLGLRAVRAGAAWRQAPDASRGAFRSSWQPFAMGLIHGAAGTGAATVLASSEMGGVLSGLVFLGIFGFGSVLGMATIAGTLAIPVQRVAKVARYRGMLLVLAGVISFAIGIWWMIAAVTA